LRCVTYFEETKDKNVVREREKETDEEFMNEWMDG